MPPNKVKKAERLYEKIKEAHISSVLELQKKIKVAYPYERLKGTGWAFFINPETKEMTRITLGKQITRVSENPDRIGRHLVFIDGQYVLVPQDLIEDIGYN
jgi:hypothetical protein